MKLSEFTKEDNKLIRRNKFLQISILTMVLVSLSILIILFNLDSSYNEQIKLDKIRQSAVNEASAYSSLMFTELNNLLIKEYTGSSEKYTQFPITFSFCDENYRRIAFGLSVGNV